MLCCGLWGGREELDGLMAGREFVLGYPVADESITGSRLACCVFDHIMLERRDRVRFPHYERVEALFASCGIGLEHPHDMLEWIWLHIAINAGVVAVAGMYGDVGDTARSAERLMGSTRMLVRAVRAIRETSGIVASRGVKKIIVMNLSNFSYRITSYDEIAYELPESSLYKEHYDTRWQNRIIVIDGDWI